jgi:hypothetical protein
MTKFEGKCLQCGKVHYSNRKDGVAVCDCWRYCPLCGAEMVPYTPDLAPSVYGIDGKRELAILMACVNHSSPFFSTQKPVEVVCT